MVWFSWLSTSSALEFAWKFRCAEIKSISSVVKLTLACSRALELIEPKVPELASPASGVPESKLSRQEVPPICVKPCSLAKLTKAIRDNGREVPLLKVALIKPSELMSIPVKRPTAKPSCDSEVTSKLEANCVGSLGLGPPVSRLKSTVTVCDGSAPLANIVGPN